MRKKLKPKPSKYEYLLNVSQKYDELKKKYLTIFQLQTVQEFINFKYELIVKEKIKGRQINYKIMGLDTPKLMIPGNGPAIYEKSYSELSGAYQIEITNLDGMTNIFQISIAADNIQLLESEKKKFIEISLVNTH
jgi:hypothetical protein